MHRNLLVLFYMIIISLITANGNKLIAQDLRTKQNGIYKTYQEFLDNKPTVTKAFKIVSDTSIDIKNNDTAYGVASYIFLDGSKLIKDIWGLGDSGKIYVRFKSIGLIELKNMGRYPFIVFDQKNRSNVFISPNLVGTAISVGVLAASLASRLANPTNTVVGYFDDRGKCIIIQSKFDMHGLLRPQKDLYNAFADEKNKNVEVYVKYLLLLNERYPLKN